MTDLDVTDVGGRRLTVAYLCIIGVHVGLEWSLWTLRCVGANMFVCEF